MDQFKKLLESLECYFGKKMSFIEKDFGLYPGIGLTGVSLCSIAREKNGLDPLPFHINLKEAPIFPESPANMPQSCRSCTVYTSKAQK